VIPQPGKQSQCRPVNEVRLRFERSVAELNLGLSTIRRNGDGSSFQSENPSYIPVILRGAPRDVARGLLADVSVDAGTQIGSGYSGSPVFIGEPNQKNPAALGVIVRQFPRLDGEPASPSALVQRLFDLMPLPRSGLDPVLKLVPLSDSGAEVAKNVKLCRFTKNQSSAFLALDGFDQYKIALIASGSLACPSEAAKNQSTRLKTILKEAFASRLLFREWPDVSLNPAGFAAEEVARSRQCAKGAAPRPPKGSDSLGDREVDVIYSAAISAALVISLRPRLNPAR
jgi:hypothetical protein